jgi:tRNA threonylcarbamoyladenosine biosynthesis protein TsaB
MKALAIETSGRIGSVALVDDGAVVAEEAFEHGLKHAAEILPMIDRLCQGRGWGPKDLQEVYVSAGPGSFTGLRIGITLAKTLAFAIGVKLVAVPTVRVLAENAPPQAKHVVIVLDAKRDQVFTARFERVSNEWVEREGAHLDSLTAMIQRAPKPLCLVGEGIPYHRKFIPTGEDGVVTGEESWRARAAVVAKIGGEMARRGEFVDPFKLTPIYVRKPEAEEKREMAERAGLSPQ